MTRLCRSCGQPFEPVPAQRKLCSPACERAQKAKRTRASQERSWKRHAAWGRTKA